MMNKKGFGLIILVIVGVVALLVGFFAASSFAQLGPPGSISDRTINAHKCAADGICEVNAVGSATGANLIRVLSGLDLAGIIRTVGGAQLDDVIIEGKFVYTRNGSTSNLVLYGDSGEVLIDSNLRVDGITTFTGQTGNEIRINPDVEFPILVSSWVGPIQNGTGYVCVNNQGFLFRSSTPCV